ncbi:MAG: F0F1 ATP synthase subunit A [Bacillota bacterium]|jgi:F-type H+-transporting ATPase subunit a
MDRFLDAPLVVFRIGTIPISETVLISWIIMGVMVGGGYILTRRLRRRPTGVQSVLELLVNGLTSLVSMTMGRDKLGFLGYVGALVLFILVSNILGVTGLRPPTSDINVTMALALLTFLATQYYRFHARGFGGYVKSFAEPVAFIFPLNVISELAAPVSLGMRLFGNILGGSVIVAMIYSVVPLVIPLPFHLYFDLFVGVVQTYIFAMLTMVFVKMALE